MHIKRAATMPSQQDDVRDVRRLFIALWLVVTLLKVGLATQLPLFVDEAFYWQEGQHLAWAYSDLPGLTAWLIRLGVEVGGHTHLGVRWPFLAMAAILPWWLISLARRELGDERAAWLVGSATVLLPLSGTLGLLALPDVPMALATVLCIDAGARLLRRVDHAGALLLALGLGIGALSHYRFIAVIGVGIVALAALPAGRAALRDARTWVAIAFGAAAWAPLVAWNLGNAEAGLRFQLVDRHPWALHGDGVLFVPIQLALVTPLLFAALAWAAWRFARPGQPEVLRLCALLGGLVVTGFFVLGFFADTERVSFHWPLPGYLALLVLLPAALARWPAWCRRATWTLAALGLAGVFAYYTAVSVPAVRAYSAGTKWYPGNFAGWGRLSSAVDAALAQMPAETRVVADNFKIGAELGFARRDPRIAVLDHPLNRGHGRAPQLVLWGLDYQAEATPTLLVVGASDVPYRQLLARYHALCRQFGPLPAPEVLNIDGGGQRFLLFRLPDGARPSEAGCVAPAMAWVDAPASGGSLARPAEVVGWAFKDGVGLERVEVLLDGAVLAQAEYGVPLPGVAAFWEISNDPNHPNVGFRARIADDALPRPGRYRLGLRLHGRDGSVEEWSEQPVRVE